MVVGLRGLALLLVSSAALAGSAWADPDCAGGLCLPQALSPGPSTAGTPIPAPAATSSSPSAASTSTGPTAKAATPAPTSSAPRPRATNPLPAHCLAGRHSGTVRSVLTYGAVGDGATDDTAALRKAVAALQPGDTLTFPAGRVFRHTDVLTVGVPRVRLTGGGTLRATNEARSAVLLNADQITMDGLTLEAPGTTKRWETFEQMKLRLGPREGISVKNVRVNGAAAAGVYVGGASCFLLADVTVENSRADGIHLTGGAHDGTVLRPVVRNTGDDGVAVVSYGGDTAITRQIHVDSPRFYGNTWGRAFTVVGGSDITYTNVYAERSNAAAIYVAAEPTYDTYGSQRIIVDGGTVRESNLNAKVDHGAIVVYSGQDRVVNSDITIRNIAVQDTRPTASRTVSVISDSVGARQQRILFAGLTITGGPATSFFANVPATSYTRRDWRVNGQPVRNHIGW